MEYANGGSLKKYLKENIKNLTWEDKYKLGYQLANAVSCLHDKEIVHRDLVIYSNYYLFNHLLYIIIHLICILFYYSTPITF